MGDLKKRIATVRARYSSPYFYLDRTAHEALRRAKEYFRTDNESSLAYAMAEILFGAPGRGRKKGKILDDNWHLQLGFAYFEVRYEHPRLSDVKIAEIISKNPQFKEYRSNPELLRQRLGEAKRQYSLWEEWKREEAESDSSLEYDADRDDE
jgi:hypothetical protein